MPKINPETLPLLKEDANKVDSKMEALKRGYEYLAFVVKGCSVWFPKKVNHYLVDWQVKIQEIQEFSDAIKKTPGDLAEISPETRAYTKSLLSTHKKFPQPPLLPNKSSEYTEKYLQIPSELRLFEMWYTTYIANENIMSFICGVTNTQQYSPEVKKALEDYAMIKKQFSLLLKQVIATHIGSLEKRILDPLTGENVLPVNRGEETFSAYWKELLEKLYCISGTYLEKYLEGLLIKEESARSSQSSRSFLFTNAPDKSDSLRLDATSMDSAAKPTQPDISETVVEPELPDPAKKISFLFDSQASVLTGGAFAYTVGLKEAQAIGEGLRTNTSLQTLDFTGITFITNPKVPIFKPIFDGLLKNTTLQTLQIHNPTFVGDNEIDYSSIGRALETHPALNCLSLDYISLAQGAVSLLSSLQSNSSLTNLNMTWCEIPNTYKLLPLLQNVKNLKKVDLSENEFATETQLCDDLPEIPVNLESLCLKGNNIQDAYLPFLVSFLRNCKNLDSLNLSNNSLSPTGTYNLLVCLAQLLNLKNLNLSTNVLGVEGARVVASWLETATLTKLDLDFNALGDTGAEMLANALKVNSSLLSLSLFNNSIGSAGAQALTCAQATNPSLQDLKLLGLPIEKSGVNSDRKRETSTKVSYKFRM
jgi:Leucine Rich repeat